jgi:hypothetical protein
MTFLFWLLFVIDLLVSLLIVIGKGFRESFTDSPINAWFSILIFACTLGALILRFAFKKELLSLIVAALPLVILLVWYLVDTKQS